MWNVTLEPHLLVELPQEHTFQTTLADIFFWLSALWLVGRTLVILEVYYESVEAPAVYVVDKGVYGLQHMEKTQPKDSSNPMKVFLYPRVIWDSNLPRILL